MRTVAPGVRPWVRQCRQPVGLVVLHLADHRRVAGGKIRQFPQVAPGQFALRRRNRVAVRVFQRLAEVLRQRLFEARGDRVFQRLRLGVHFAPIQAEDAGQKEFYEAVAADDPACLGQAAGGKSCALARLVRDPPVGGQAFQHPRDRRRADGEQPGDVGRGNDVVRPAEPVDGFQVILDRGRGFAASWGRSRPG